jgi:hypothetical protein
MLPLRRNRITNIKAMFDLLVDVSAAHLFSIVQSHVHQYIAAAFLHEGYVVVRARKIKGNARESIKPPGLRYI